MKWHRSVLFVSLSVLAFSAMAADSGDRDAYSCMQTLRRQTGHPFDSIGVLIPAGAKVLILRGGAVTLQTDKAPANLLAKGGTYNLQSPQGIKSSAIFTAGSGGVTFLSGSDNSAPVLPYTEVTDHKLLVKAIKDEMGRTFASEKSSASVIGKTMRICSNVEGLSDMVPEAWIKDRDMVEKDANKDAGKSGSDPWSGDVWGDGRK